MMSNLSVRENDVRVESWCELCERLYENSWQDNLMRYRSDYAFRGLSNASYGLASRLKRYYTPRS